MSRLVIAAVAASFVLASPALAETVQLSIEHDRTTVLHPLFSLERQSCTAYPVSNIRIDPQPANGRIMVVEKPAPLPKSFAQCAGKVVRAKWLVYEPRRGFKGDDSFSLTYTHFSNTGDLTQVYIRHRYMLKVQ